MSTDREKQLKRALCLALSMLGPHESGDSRAVSDEFVALATVVCDIDDGKTWRVIDEALDRQHHEPIYTKRISAGELYFDDTDSGSKA